MSKKRIVLEKNPNCRAETEEARVYPHTYKVRGVEYFNYIVRGWSENGKKQRKQFPTEEKAQTFADTININLKNRGTKQGLILSSLSQEQVTKAERAFRALGENYDLEDVVAFYLKHHRPPEFTISLLDGLKLYLDEKEREGVRLPTRKTTNMVLKSFAEFTDNAEVHTVTEESVVLYLKSLRSLDGVTAAKKKTWNNHRNELASFFLWAGKKDLSTNRPWTFNNPTEHVLAHSVKRVAEERPDIATTSPETTKELFSYLMNFKGGRLVKWFALAYFAGIRPSTDLGELAKLSEREGELINLTTGRIMLTADMTKTKDSRPIQMSENLIAWLKAYEGFPIMPVNLKNDYRAVRQKFNLQSDETRHSFISYHIALHRSIGSTAQEAGNSERMIKRHYLDHRPAEEGVQFFNIAPDMKTKQAIIQKPSKQASDHPYIKAI